MNNLQEDKGRRVAERRTNVKERRELVRYEIHKAPRRSGRDRRKFNHWVELSEYSIM